MPLRRSLLRPFDKELAKLVDAANDFLSSQTSRSARLAQLTSRLFRFRNETVSARFHVTWTDVSPHSPVFGVKYQPQNLGLWPRCRRRVRGPLNQSRCCSVNEQIIVYRTTIVVVR